MLLFKKYAKASLTSGGAIEGYTKVWKTFDLEGLNHVLFKKSKLMKPDKGYIKGLDEIIEWHEILFEKIAKSQIPYVIVEQYNIKRRWKAKNKIVQVKVLTPDMKVLADLLIIHCVTLIDEIVLLKDNFLEGIEKYDFSQKDLKQLELDI